MKNGDQPAYPQHYESDELRLSIMKNGGQPKGMSKREAFAMAAMQGLLSNAPFIQAMGHHNMDHKNIVSVAIGVADELLKQLDV